MIFNFYIPESDTKLINQIKSISEEKRRSVSFIVREALESYVFATAQKKATIKSLGRSRREKQKNG